MTLLQAILSGIVQGVTEFIPVSSSGHLVLLHDWFGIPEKIQFFLALHAATLLAMTIYFAKDLKSIFTEERRLGLLVLAGCAVTFAAGFFLESAVESAFASVHMAAMGLIAGGVWILTASFVSRLFFTGRRKNGIFMWQAVLIGLAQAVSLFPGVSRSGASISTGLLTGIEKETAFRYSFLLLIPTTLGALFYEIYTSNFIRSEDALYTAAGMASAFFAGLISLKILYKIIKSGRFYIFGIYCIFAGLVALAR